MELLLERLCDLLDDELERQENVLALCIAQGKAAREHDHEYLEARTVALGELIEETVRAEAARFDLVGQIVEAYELPIEEQTLSHLIKAAPKPWSLRLRELQHRLRAVLAETQQAVRANSRVMRRSVKVIDEAVTTLTQCGPQAGGNYDARGKEKARVAREPSMIDQRG